MTDTSPPSLRATIVRMMLSPSVEIVTEVGSQHARGHWRFVGLDAGALYFETTNPRRGRKLITDLPLGPSEGGREPAIHCDADGFWYHRHPIKVRINFLGANP